MEEITRISSFCFTKSFETFHLVDCIRIRDILCNPVNFHSHPITMPNAYIRSDIHLHIVLKKITMPNAFV